jgi:GrpB-like predicted nucleotidyltransferase (UPF0157 family)/RimJ/RimL family protein N-acetyltransferase
MIKVTIREPTLNDKNEFIKAMQRSQELHNQWVHVPVTPDEFDKYLQRYQQTSHKSFLVCEQSGNIAGVFNISEIVRGLFQNAYLGFYAVIDYANKGYMSAGLRLVLSKTFTDLALHRLEANIQPDNVCSIQLVKNNGFRYEGFSPRYLKINGEWHGHEHWAITLEDYIRNEPEVLEKDHVELVPYNPEWSTLAQKEMAKLKTIFPANKIIDIQHIGSTAIPGLSAKPIIDIQIGVSSLEDMKLIAIPLLQKLNYEYWSDNPDPTRMFFVKGMPPYGEMRTHHVHIFEYNSDHWRNKLIFRDYLRKHPALAKQYGELKAKLAAEHLHDREKYTDAKLEFVNKILQLANQS